MDNIEIFSMLEEFRNVQDLPYFWHNGEVFFIAPRANGMELAACLRITGRKEGNIIAARDQPLGQKGDHAFPRAVMLRRRAPSNRREHRNAHSLSLIHISEPTRLLSISYAVFCLKKKKQK